jgi:hypothetical protein
MELIDKPDWLARCIAVLLAGFVFTVTFNIDQVSSSAWLIISQGIFIILCSQLLLPAAKTLGLSLVNSGAAVLVLIGLVQLPVAGMVPVPMLFRICIVTFCLSIFLWSLRQLLEAAFSGLVQVRTPVLFLTALTVTAPVWLGPFAEMVQPYNSVVNGIISINPLTHFAVAMEYDYLRSQWFYRNTPFGSLPFAYPDMISIVTTYIISVICMQVTLWWTSRYKVHFSQPQRRSLIIS